MVNIKRCILAIDPDTNKSGVALLDTETREFIEITAESFAPLSEKIRQLPSNTRIVIEGGWLNRSNWHLSHSKSQYTACKIGNATGRNHETGRKLVEIAEYYKKDVIVIKPLVKCWSGTDGKITAEELKEIAGIEKRTNQDERDACLIAWCMAGFPIKISPKNRNKQSSSDEKGKGDYRGYRKRGIVKG